MDIDQPPNLGVKIRRLDVFKKVSSDFSTGTNTGGCLSLLTVLVIAFFLYCETIDFMNPIYTSSLVRNKLLSREEMMITLDIEFPRFPCELLSLDLQDIMFSHHSNIASVKKYRLDSAGSRIDSSDFEILNNNNPFEQMEAVELAIKNKYGCRVTGSFTVKEAPGNFHISSHAYEPNYVRSYIKGLFKGLDVSHIIHKLHFGQADVDKIYAAHPEAELMRLDGHNRTYNDPEASFVSNYHLSIVPTTYAHILGSTSTYQYTWNHNSSPLPENEMAIVNFQYELEGITVAVQPLNSGLFWFLMRVCFIVGGVYAIAAFLDRMLYALCGKPGGYELIE